MRKERYIIKILSRIAKKSHARCKHAAAVVNNGKIISLGYNYAKKNNGYHSIHAERDALLKCNKQKLNGSSLYVIRLNCSNYYKTKLLLSKPCISCEKLINSYKKKYKLKSVYYSI